LERSYIYQQCLIYILYNGEIINYTIGSRPTYSLISMILEQSFENLTVEESVLIHSDQG